MQQNLPEIVKQKMSYTPEEQEKVILGSINYKQTDTWKRAKKYFKKRCEQIVRYGYTLDSKRTKRWFAHKNRKTWVVKMIFVFSENKKTFKHHKVNFDDIFKNYDQIFKNQEELFKNMGSPFESFFGKNRSN